MVYDTSNDTWHLGKVQPKARSTAQHGTALHSSAPYGRARAGHGRSRAGHGRVRAGHGRARPCAALHGAAVRSAERSRADDDAPSLWYDIKLRATTKQRVKEEIKEKLDRSASNDRRRCPSGTPGDARDAPIEHFQQKDKNKYFCIYFEVY